MEIIHVKEEDAYGFAIGINKNYKLIASLGSNSITHRNIFMRKRDKKLFEFIFVFLSDKSEYHGDINGYVLNDLNLYEVRPVERVIVDYERVYN